MEKSEQAEVLKWMLGQVYRAEDHKKRLEKRLIRINAEKESPIGGANYSPLPRGAQESEGAASITFRLADVEDRIIEQKNEIARCMNRVMDIIEFIPITEVDREIFELRHIDCLPWPEIEEAIPMSKRQCIRRYNDAIDRLLEKPEIREMVAGSEAQYIAWCVSKKPKKQSGGMSPKNKAGNKSGKNNRKK